MSGLTGIKNGAGLEKNIEGFANSPLAKLTGTSSQQNQSSQPAPIIQNSGYSVPPSVLSDSQGLLGKRQRPIASPINEQDIREGV
jgi:hypothetical protein